MNMFTYKEVVENFSVTGVKKAGLPVWRMLLLGILAGTFIAFGCATTTTATHSLTDVSTGKLISGLLFCGGIFMVLLMGAELFTSNCLLLISVLDKKIRAVQMLKSLVFVYIGNFIGGMLVAYCGANFGQMNYSDGGLAVYTIKQAIGKSTMPFENALVLGIFCNMLVCTAVLCSLCAKDVAGRFFGTFLPIAFFIICGFEHCVANMYYISAGIFASHIPAYAAKAAEAGLDLSVLTWGNFFGANLLPVTIGNILGGMAIAAILWFGHIYHGKEAVKN